MIGLHGRVDESRVLRYVWLAQAARTVRWRDDGWRVAHDALDQGRPYLLVRDAAHGVIEVLGADYTPLRLDPE